MYKDTPGKSNPSKSLSIAPLDCGLVPRSRQMGAVFQSDFEECPILWSFDDFVFALQALATAWIASPFQEAQLCHLLLVNFFVLGSPWRPLGSTIYLLVLGGTLPALESGTVTLPSGFVITGHWQGTPRVLFN